MKSGKAALSCGPAGYHFDMRIRLFSFATACFLLAIFIVPHFAHAAIPNFGPIIPKAYDACAAGWGMVITVINNLIEIVITLLLVFVAPIMIAWSGFLFVLNPVNAHGKEQAKSILMNTILGIVVALSAWMIIDAVLVGLTGQGVDAWTSLIGSGGAPQCLTIKSSLNQTSNGTGITGVSASGNVNYTGTTAQCSSSNTACSPSALQAAGLSSNQANAMSCIAVTESSGRPSTPPYNSTHPGSNSSACGTFQITQTTWSGTATGACSDFASSCQNAQCNLQVAAALVKQSGYSSWTCPNCNPNAQACIQKYGG